MAKKATVVGTKENAPAAVSVGGSIMRFRQRVHTHAQQAKAAQRGKIATQVSSSKQLGRQLGRQLGSC